jgi:hypothetical protein
VVPLRSEQRNEVDSAKIRSLTRHSLREGFQRARDNALNRYNKAKLLRFVYPRYVSPRQQRNSNGTVADIFRSKKFAHGYALAVHEPARGMSY